jgi:hypothetical protein
MKEKEGEGRERGEDSGEGDGEEGRREISLTSI